HLLRRCRLAEHDDHADRQKRSCPDGNTEIAKKIATSVRTAPIPMSQPQKRQRTMVGKLRNRFAYFCADAVIALKASASSLVKTVCPWMKIAPLLAIIFLRVSAT